MGRRKSEKDCVDVGMHFRSTMVLIEDIAKKVSVFTNVEIFNATQSLLSLSL